MPALHTPVITLETSRLRLRQWQEEDFAPFAQINNDPNVMAFFRAPLCCSDSDGLGKRLQQLIHDNGWGVWAVEHKENAQFIGCVGLHIPSPDLPFSPCVEIAWRIAHPYWGQGLATEAAQAALYAGFNVLNLEEIVAFTTVTNKRSQKLMERLGMQFTQTFAHPHLPASHPLKTHRLYRLKKAQFLCPEEPLIT